MSEKSLGSRSTVCEPLIYSAAGTIPQAWVKRSLPPWDGAAFPVKAPTVPQKAGLIRMLRQTESEAFLRALLHELIGEIC